MTAQIIADHHDHEPGAALIAEEIDGGERQCHRQPIKAEIVRHGVRSLTEARGPAFTWRISSSVGGSVSAARIAEPVDGAS
jgi:hypothetical protein